MNNNFYALTRYLRDEGYDAHLFYRLAMEHFQPKADTYSDGYTDYCHEVNWLDSGFHNVDLGEVQEQLKGFDFYIGQGEEAAVAYAAGFHINVYYPYGSDIYKYAQLPAEYSIPSKLVSIFSNDATRPTYKQMKRGTMAKSLRGAISTADFIFAEATNDEFERELKKLNYKGNYEQVAMPFIYNKEYEYLNETSTSANPHAGAIERLRREHDFVILYHGRQEWKTYHNDFTGKNTHHLIHGFSQYTKKHPDSRACLAMLEYGSDAEQSKKLIADLGMESKVHWFPTMYRKELMYLVKNADVCCGEFNHSYLTFGTVVEAMLMKKPVITFRDDRLYSAIYPQLYPCFNAREPEEIAAAIEEAAAHPLIVKQMGEEAYAWIKMNFIDKPLKRLLEVIEQS